MHSLYVHGFKMHYLHGTNMNYLHVRGTYTYKALKWQQLQYYSVVNVLIDTVRAVSYYVPLATCTVLVFRIRIIFMRIRIQWGKH